jgi:predicted nuclease of predicted toxin-antitoxin system
MKLPIDMNLSPDWAAALGLRSISAIHWADVGRADATDAELTANALQHDPIVLTHDSDFGTILALTSAAGPSVIRIRGQQARPAVTADFVAMAVNRFRSELTAGAQLAVDLAHSRARVPPIRGNPNP